VYSAREKSIDQGVDTLCREGTGKLRAPQLLRAEGHHSGDVCLGESESAEERSLQKVLQIEHAGPTSMPLVYLKRVQGMHSI
jgi:hypothetical protein